MKLKGILAILLLTVLTFTGCKKPNGFDEIRLGYTGGITGGGDEFTIKSNGEVYWIGADTLRKTLSQPVIDEINDRISDLSNKSLKADETEYGCCDQTANYIRLKDGNDEWDMRWTSDGGDKYEELQTFFAYLYNVCV